MLKILLKLANWSPKIYTAHQSIHSCKKINFSLFTHQKIINSLKKKITSALSHIKKPTNPSIAGIPLVKIKIQQKELVYWTYRGNLVKEIRDHQLGQFLNKKTKTKVLVRLYSKMKRIGSKDKLGNYQKSTRVFKK